MNNKFPLYPSLGEAGENESQELINQFKEQLKKAADEVIGNLYSDITPYIESDSWGNFRNQIMDGFKNYDNRKIQSEYDFKEIRQSTLKHHREDIINDLQVGFDKKIITKAYLFNEFNISREKIQNYYYKNPQKPFCEMIINPKLNKLVSQFKDKVNRKKLSEKVI